MIATSVLKEAAKDDLRDLEGRVGKDIDGLRQEIMGIRKEIREVELGLRREISDLSQRVSRLEGSMSLFVKLFIVFSVPIPVGIMRIPLKMIFS